MARRIQLTSAPVVSRGIVVVGSSIEDNVRVEAPRGTVRAFDARSGKPRWSFDPLVHDGIDAGHANAWAPMSADEERGLVFADDIAEPGFLGRQAARRLSTPIPSLRSKRDRRTRLVVPDRASRRLGLRPAGTADAGAHRHRRWHARRGDAADQAGFLFVLDRDTGKPVGRSRSIPCRKAARRREVVADPAVSNSRAGADPQQFSSDDIFNFLPRDRLSILQGYARRLAQ